MAEVGTKNKFKIIDPLLLRSPVIDKCSGCARIEFNAQVLEGDKLITIDACAAYIDPKMKWRLGNCGLATNVVIEETKAAKYKAKKYGKKRRNR